MKWNYIIGWVLQFYFQFAGVFLAYHISKFYTSQPTKLFTDWDISIKMECILNMIVRYAVCLAVVFGISLFASQSHYGKTDDPVDSADLGKQNAANYNRGAIIFLYLVIPTLIGATKGFTDEEDQKVSTISHGNME